MSIDVGKAIHDLLFEHSTVIVPGLGGFTSEPQPASVDYVQGVIAPPSKKIEFNPNLVVNDGVLVHHIQQGHTVTFQEAKEAVDRFVDEVKQALERREIVEIPNVGRLYKDYEHKIRFMAEGSNFNAEAFGLPAVQFSPVAKERQAAPAHSGPSKTPQKTASTPAREAEQVPETAAVAEPKPLVQKLLPWLVLATAVILALSVYLMFGGEKKEEGGQAVDPGRLNVKPKPEEQIAGQDTMNLPADESPAAAPPEQKTPEPGAGNQGAASPGKNEFFVVVHSFGNRNNATKFAQQLSEDGYTPETRHVGTLYRVGVIQAFNSRPEVENLINELGSRYKATPKVFEEMDEQQQ